MILSKFKHSFWIVWSCFTGNLLKILFPYRIHVAQLKMSSNRNNWGIIFLTSLSKCMLWVLVRIALSRQQGNSSKLLITSDFVEKHGNLLTSEQSQAMILHEKNFQGAMWSYVCRKIEKEALLLFLRVHLNMLWVKLTSRKVSTFTIAPHKEYFLV